MAISISVDEKAFSDLLEPLFSEHLARMGAVLNARSPEDEKMFDVSSLASYLGVSKDWVYGMVRKKEIPYYKIGSNNRFSKQGIDLWLGERLSTPVSTNPADAVLERLRKRVGDS